MHVAIAHERLSVARGPPRRAAIEVDRRGEHRVDLDRLKKVTPSVHVLSKATPQREERMRRDDKSGLALCQTLEVRERSYLFGTAPKIEEQHVTALDRLLDARNQNQAAFGGIRCVRRDVELPFVQGDGERVIAMSGSCVNQLRSRMGNPIERVVGRVGMEFDLQHTAAECSEIAPSFGIGASRGVPYGRRANLQSLKSLRTLWTSSETRRPAQSL